MVSGFLTYPKGESLIGRSNTESSADVVSTTTTTNRQGFDLPIKGNLMLKKEDRAFHKILDEMGLG